MRSVILFSVLLAGCTKTVSTTDLRLIAHDENGRQWVEITAPSQTLKINDWIRACPANVEVLYQSPRVLSLGCRSAAPVYVTFRLEDGARLALRDIIQVGREGQLQEAINRYLRRTKQSAFSPSDSFAMAAQGLLFPTPEGDVVVSSIELRPLLRPDVALLVGR